VRYLTFLRAKSPQATRYYSRNGNLRKNSWRIPDAPQMAVFSAVEFGLELAIDGLGRAKL
jgi:hypothetical protein